MLDITQNAAQKREAFRQALKGSKTLQMPGAFSPLCARMIEQKNFDGIYLSGAVISAELGLPDIGLTTMSEVSQRGSQIARSTNLPALLDIDTGFGEPMNLARTIHEIEDLGIAACHIEDQVNPKRCGHLDNKSVVDVATMSKRIKTAVDAKRDENFLIMARTDARALEGVDAAIERAKAYVDAGAEAIFAEAMYTEQEFEQFRAAIDVPILANMTEFGKSELLDIQTLNNVGVNMVIYPVTCLRLAMGMVDRGLEAILEDGSQKNVLNDMQHRQDLYNAINYEGYNQFDSSIFNFEIKK